MAASDPICTIYAGQFVWTGHMKSEVIADIRRRMSKCLQGCIALHRSEEDGGGIAYITYTQINALIASQSV